MAARGIVIQDLGKRFRRYHVEKPSTFHEALLRGFRKLAPSEYFWGLRNITYEIAPGQVVGVVGRNGAGKSTLLRLIGGLGRPDEGSIQLHGQIGALLALGAGFNPELTGRENLFINGIVRGFTRKEVKASLDSIVAFSELEEFIDSPLRVYSSGMQMRLAFSIAIHSSPDILLVDEVLSVGDVKFQRKCLDRIEQLKASGCTIILVSHDTGRMAEFCQECLWLRAGRLEAHGPARAVINKYLADANATSWSHIPVGNTAPPTVKAEPVAAPPVAKEPQSVEITGVTLLDSAGLITKEMDSGGPLSMEIRFVTRRVIAHLNFSVSIHREDGVCCCDVSTQNESASLPDVSGVGRIVLHLEELVLNGGLYYIHVSAFGDDPLTSYDIRDRMASITIRPNGNTEGIVRVAHRWDTKRPVGDLATVPTVPHMTFKF